MKILVIDEARQRAHRICAELAVAGHEVVAILADTTNLNAEVERLLPDIILIETESPGRDTLENLAVMRENAPRPVVMLSGDDEESTIRAAVRAGVSAYVVDGLAPSRLKPVIEVARAHFERDRELRQEIDTAARKLSGRKLVERAKGLLMKTGKHNEEEAYHALRKLAMQRGKSIEEVARDVVDMLA